MNHIAISTELWVNEEEKIASFHDTEQWKYLVFPNAEQMIHYLDYFPAVLILYQTVAGERFAFGEYSLIHSPVNREDNKETSMSKQV